MTSFTWFDMIPVFGVVVTIVGINLKAGRMLQKLDNVIDTMSELKEVIKEPRKELKNHRERITVLETKVNTIKKKLETA